MNFSYIGNGAYCYSNSTAMLLTSIGEDISPSTIEVLSGVGLGAFQLKDSNIAFFSNFLGLPDKGISKALDILGFKYLEKAQNDKSKPPFELLEKLLQKSPVLLGPLDMGYLTYNPKHKYLNGVDHFVFS